VVAHPTKEHARYRKGDKPEDGMLPVAVVPTLYDIEGWYSDDTELLTRSGFKYHGELTKNDEIACFDMKTEQIVYHRPLRIIRREHDGEMWNLRGEQHP
jgi:hypothetical protein